MTNSIDVPLDEILKKTREYQRLEKENKLLKERCRKLKSIITRIGECNNLINELFKLQVNKLERDIE